MSFEKLDCESEQQLSELLKMPAVLNYNCSGTAIEHLILQGYVKGGDVRELSDTEPSYVLYEITQKGKTYFEQKDLMQKDKKELSKREWIIATVSAAVGATVGVLIEQITKFL
jgi:hypothetical protein